MTEIQRSFFGAELPGVAIAGDSISFGVFGILLEVFFGRERTVLFKDLFGEHQVTMDVPVFLIKGGGFIVDGIAECMLIADAMGLRLSDADPVAAGLAAVEAVKALKKMIGLLETLKDFQVPDDPVKLQPTVELAASDSQIGYNPRYLEDAEILDLLRKAI